MKPKIFVALAVLVAAAAGFFLFSQTAKPAPEVAFMTIDGRTVTTAELRGKVMLVNFWATTCTTCIKEMPRLVETHKRFATERFDTVAVAMSYDPPSQVLAYAKREKLPFTVALDVGDAAAKAFGGVRLTPTTFLIDKQGNIVRQYLGEPDFAKLNALIQELLAA